MPEEHRWFEGSRWGAEGPPLEAYSRVTNAERFRPLHAAMLGIIDRLVRDFEVRRTEGYGLDEDLERRVEPARLSINLTPIDPGAAAINIIFSAFPGVHLRLGRWYREPFPSCGCDACGESVEGEIERLANMVDDITSGRFREAIDAPLLPFIGPGWVVAEFWSPNGRDEAWSRSTSRVSGIEARRRSGGRRRLSLDWKPWERRKNAP